ncbi:hypothetical protein SAMN05446935_10272 [Burkholderia sp. YR290]|uniref:hypothetical protein n=1 Tax=Paraburkholderia hospita TaxID=169430 RepID=UPI0009A64A09|nr:hypothetical protein [Paraburkholderia hospita]SKC92828.1 hypothetical protein SAMN05446934_6268 [Paraburkholderia hospita]SOE90953.1 hypothetical protein SAMN05446935_10272 [Burkholderia sp. YR290]
MRIRSAECLLFVAIATSAIVAQVRAHTLPSNVPTQTAPHTTRMQACDEPHNGILRAACEAQSEHHPIDSEDRPTNGVDTPHAGKLWV